MALVKEFEQETGVSIQYWHIAEYNINYVKNEGYSGIIKVNGYLSKDARVSGKTLIATKEYSIDKYLEPKEEMIKSLYVYLKTLGDFLDAKDD